MSLVTLMLVHRNKMFARTVLSSYHQITLDWELIGFAGHVDLSIRACLVSLVFLAVYAAFDLPSVLRADRDFMSSLVVVFEQSPTPAKTIECLSPAYQMPSFMLELSGGTVSFKSNHPPTSLELSHMATAGKAA